MIGTLNIYELKTDDTKIIKNVHPYAADITIGDRSRLITAFIGVHYFLVVGGMEYLKIYFHITLT